MSSTEIALRSDLSSAILHRKNNDSHLVLSTFFIVLYNYCSVSVQTLSNTDILDKQDKNYSYLHLIKTPNIRKLTLLTGIVWWV